MNAISDLGREIAILFFGLVCILLFAAIRIELRLDAILKELRRKG